MWLAVPKAGAAGIFQQMSRDKGEKETLNNNAEVIHTKIDVFNQSSGLIQNHNHCKCETERNRLGLHFIHAA